MLMSVGRLDPSSRYSELALNCNLLPGAPLPVYSALTGRRTNDALKLLRDQARDAVFIALTTGNWIRLRRTAPVCPIPLARGHGHLEFKQAIFDNADEIFVVTPLGKIFVDTALSDVNIALGLSEDDPDPEKKPYYEVQVNNNKADFVKLISTSRKPHRLLSHHSTYVQSCLGVYDLDLDQILEKFKGATISEINHIFFPFDVLPNDQHMQMEIEFPHSGTRNEKFAQRFFHIPSVQ